MKAVGAGLGLDFHRARPVAAVLGAVIRGQHFEFGDGLQAGIDVQRAVAAVIHVVAAVQFPVVVLHTAAVDAEAYVAVDADRAFILAGLIAYAGDQRDQLREVPSVQLQLGNLLSVYGAGKVRRLGLHLGNITAFDRNFFLDRAHFQRDVGAGLLAYLEHDCLGLISLEAGATTVTLTGPDGKPATR